MACDDGSSDPAQPAEPQPPDAGDEVMEGAGEASDKGCELPGEPAALVAYLHNGGYKKFAHESAVHASSGPHGGRVLTYVNDLLADSLAANQAEHPRCAASVKELFLGNGEVSGWAVFVKTEDASANGQGYYWLEIVSTSPNRPADYEGQGIGVCVGCHSAGRDYFRAPWPLQ
jgi:hypothetical protein